MSGISSSTGLVSGLNTGQLIEQLMQVESRPRALIQRRLAQVQSQQAAFLDINSRLGSLRSAAQSLRLNSTFNATNASSSNSETLGASASNRATPGSYSFIVDRLVSTQQVLSQGVGDRNRTGLGLTSITVESELARLDTDTNLSTLNGGAGIVRGRIAVTNRAGATTTVDLSRVQTVSEVLSAFNTNSTAGVRASVSGGRLVLTDLTNGTGPLSVASATGTTTAESLGIAGTSSTSTLTGEDLYKIGDATSIRSLRDGLGIRLNNSAGSASLDFRITARNGTTFNIDIGKTFDIANVQTGTEVSTVGQLRQRISEQTSGAITVNISSDGRRLEFVDTTTGSGSLSVTDVSGAAADLGIVQTTPGTTITSGQLQGGLNTALLTTLNGGRGLTGSELRIGTRAGGNISVNLAGTSTLADVITAINDAGAGQLRAELNSKGTGLQITDLSTGGGNLEITGSAAASLGVETTVGGVTTNTVTGTRLNRGYVAESTLLSSLNNGRGVGSGTLALTDSTGTRIELTIDDSVRSVGDLLRRINDRNGIRARINADGNGILLDQDPTKPTGTNKISVTDVSGNVGRSLNIIGTAKAAGVENVINGSQRRTVELAVGDTLDAVITKVNNAGIGATAGVVTDGASTTPFRLRVTSNFAGQQGRFLIDTAGTDLNIRTVSEGRDSRVFYGSPDAAQAILISRDSNSIDGVVEGLRLDAKRTSNDPVTVNVSRDTNAIVKSIQDFATAFNAFSSRISDVTKFDPETERRGTLQGDSTALSLRAELFATLQGPAQGVGTQYRVLAQVGLKIARDNTISFDETKLRQALEADPDAVQQVIAGFAQDAPQPTQPIPGVTGATVRTTQPGRFTRLGVLERIGQLADRYLNSVDGVLTSRNRNFDSQVQAFNDRLTSFDARLDGRRGILERQFANLESTLARLQRQQSSIGSIGVAR